MHGLDVIEVLGVPVVKTSGAEALSVIERIATDPEPSLVCYVNAHTLNLATRDPDYRRLLTEADLVLNDGIGLALAARMKSDRFPENLNGSDFNPKILDLCARRGWSVFFLGASPGVAATAATKLSHRIDGLRIAGTRDGYFPRTADPEVVAEIARTGADAVMVAMGNPLQEQWLRDNLRDTGCRLGVGVGAFFDFAAQRVKRAPAWMNRMGIEWLWRLAQEPTRLFKRYVLGNPAFLWRVAKETYLKR